MYLEQDYIGHQPLDGEDNPQTSFYRDPDRLLFASTCSLVLNIFHGVETYEKFKEKMTTAVLCGYGFGNF